MMNRCFFRAALAMGTALAGVACADTGAPVAQHEDMLASSGFVAKKADNTARMAALQALPPHRFVVRAANGRTSYLYADPTVCACIYVGDQAAYDQYRQKVAARQTATDEQIRAVLSSSPLPGESGL